MNLDSIVAFVTTLPERVRAIATSAVTFLAALVLALTQFSDEVASVVPGPWTDRFQAWTLTAVGALSAAILVLRRLTPVAPAQRGVLPQESEDD